MAKVTIETLKGKSDEELLAILGYDTKVAEFKKNIEEADKLSGKPREKVEEHITRMFTPHVYPEDLKYTIERAKRKDGKEEAACCSCDILD